MASRFKLLVLLSLVCQLSISFAFGDDSVELGPVERDGTGRVINLPHYSTSNYCRSRGSLLPSARDFALYAMQLGAKGILETAYPLLSFEDQRVKEEIERMKRENYYPIYRSNDFRRVHFYYSHEGYRPPSGEEGRRWFRSRSYHQVVVTPYVFLGYSGEIAYEYWSDLKHDLSAVRCLMLP